VFTREVQHAVLDGRADLAVHSLKDLPTETAPGLCLAAIPPRANEFDTLVFPKSHTGACDWQGLRPGAVLGTGSPRRQAQLLHSRPDFVFRNVRGNVDTRLRKLDGGEVDALVLAVAGLTRLGFLDRVALPLTPPVMYPAVGQGALGLECREEDEATRALLARLDDTATRQRVVAERGVLHALKAGCHAPVGVCTRFESGMLVLEGVVLSLDGQVRLHATATGNPTEAEALGQTVARELQRQGADRLINPGT
jgi:hydroxymethylbilane synthase